MIYIKKIFVRYNPASETPDYLHEITLEDIKEYVETPAPLLTEKEYEFAELFNIMIGYTIEVFLSDGSIYLVTKTKDDTWEYNESISKLGEADLGENKYYKGNLAGALDAVLKYVNTQKKNLKKN
jgi:hypothetical protein